MKRSPFSFKCAWCGRVRIRKQWVFERRKVWSTYRLGTCPHCKLLYTLVDATRLRIQ